MNTYTYQKTTSEKLKDESAFFLDFLRSPRQLKELDSFYDKWVVFIFCLTCSFVVAFATSFLMLLVKELELIKYDSHALNNMFKDKSIFFIVFTGAIMAPVLEEIGFRLILKYNRIFSSLLYFAVLAAIAALVSLLEDLLQYVVFAVLGFLGVAFFVRRTTFQFYLTKLYRCNFGFLFYAVALAFGLIHLINYSNIDGSYIFYSVLILPQIGLGIILGYIRLRNNFLWSIYLHAAYNFILLLMYYKYSSF